MFDFPNAPTNGQLVTGPSGQIYVWDGTSWNVSPSTAPWSINQGGTGATTASAALTNLGAVAKAGDTMTGALNLTIPLAVPSGGTGVATLPIQTLGIGPEINGTFLMGQGTSPIKTATTTTVGTMGTTNAGQNLILANTSVSPSLQLMRATGGSLSAPTALQSGIPLGGINFGGYDGAGWPQWGVGYIGATATENWSGTLHGTKVIIQNVKTGTNNTVNQYTFDGDGSLNISPYQNHCRVFLNKSGGGSTSAIYGQYNGAYRWSLELGHAVVESGSNVGSDFVIGRYADNGAWISNPLAISRATGNIDVANNLSVAGTGYVGNVLTCPTLVQCGISPNGFTTLNPGSPAYSGYIAFHLPNATRIGYVGYSNSTDLALVSDAGGVSFSGNLLRFTNKSGAANCPISLVCTTVREWQVAVQGTSGYFGILDASASAWRLTINLNGSTTFGGDIYTLGAYPQATNAYQCGIPGLDWWAVNSYRYVTASDRRLKENIEDLPDCLDLVRAIKPQRFKYNNRPKHDHGRPHWGFVAQDVAAAMQKAGHEFGGHHVGEGGTESLEYPQLIAVLWQAVSELSTQIEELKRGRI